MRIVILLRERIKALLYSSSIRSKISLSFALLFSILLVLLVIVVYQVSSKILINKAIENISQNITLVAEKFDLTFDSVEDYAKTAITNNDVQEVLTKKKAEDELTLYNDRMKIYRALDGIISLRTLVDTLFVYDFDNHCFDSGRIQNFICAFNPDYAFFKGIKSAGEGRWIDTHPSNYLERGVVQPIITLVRGVIDAESGKHIGVMETNVKEENIAKLYAQIKLGSTGKIFVVNEKGMIVSHIDKSLLNTSISKEPYYTWISNHEGGDVFKLNQASYLVISKHYARLNWNIIGMIPLNEVVKDQRAVTNKLIVFGIIAMLISIIFTIWLANSITKPIIKLKRTMQYVAEGDLEAQVEVLSKDEVGALAHTFNQMIKKTANLMNNILEKQKREEGYKLALLQSQINPHFLYNTLESICGLAELNRNQDVIHVVNKLALFYRYVLSKGSIIITIEDELLITESYLEMLKIRYGEQFNYSIDVDEKLYKFATVKLMLQPLVENALIHGLRNKRGPGSIVVKGTIEAGNACLSIIDNGIGMSPELIKQIFRAANADQAPMSFGLASTHERIKLYFGAAYGLHVESVAGQGTTVKVTLPMNEVWGEVE